MTVLKLIRNRKVTHPNYIHDLTKCNTCQTRTLVSCFLILLWHCSSKPNSATVVFKSIILHKVHSIIILIINCSLLYHATKLNCIAIAFHCVNLINAATVNIITKFSWLQLNNTRILITIGQYNWYSISWAIKIYTCCYYCCCWFNKWLWY